jgi:hypothetical protein
MESATSGVVARASVDHRVRCACATCSCATFCFARVPSMSRTSLSMVRRRVVRMVISSLMRVGCVSNLTVREWRASRDRCAAIYSSSFDRSCREHQTGTLVCLQHSVFRRFVRFCARPSRRAWWTRRPLGGVSAREADVRSVLPNLSVWGLSSISLSGFHTLCKMLASQSPCSLQARRRHESAVSKEAPCLSTPSTHVSLRR